MDRQPDALLHMVNNTYIHTYIWCCTLSEQINFTFEVILKPFERRRRRGRGRKNFIHKKLCWLNCGYLKAEPLLQQQHNTWRKLHCGGKVAGAIDRVIDATIDRPYQVRSVRPLRRRCRLFLVLFTFGVFLLFMFFCFSFHVYCKH